ncbi:SDR family oxidoreductase [Sulfitobacter sp. F26169L]|uniref:SDR family NAD(P)-dependent oxidoreductase n=1 Tax=Sulfitobacter sp. F26169L TaxID=2996015 RepID=UPI002260AC8D|nr:SDR family oxidoreductase [Sulfitobacter sp. F26169L]MCX7564749.1 SDR family oxidoreductase [Sulfitobacter sp. F26169L]
MPNTALVTGASSGIGAELARYHAARGGDVVLTARSAQALQTLADELHEKHAIKAHVFPVDLASPDGAAQLIKQITAAGVQVDILINNAGFGGQGRHIDRGISDELGMVDLNVKALVTLCHHFGGEMAQRGQGRILNVGSTAGFMPGPMQAVYFATKAFVQSFSQALDYELRPKGVTVTLLAPGYVKTAFADRAGLHGTKLVAGGGKTPQDVAKHGYDAMLRGTLVSVNEQPLGFLVNWIIPMMPRRMVLRMIARMQSK